jgi:NAD(P)-dependent dehydrogenase (short-subunit alcohol dehydrogenase family)
MQSLPNQFHTLIIGSSGAIGSAFVELLNKDERCASITKLSRNEAISMDLNHPESIAMAAQAAKEHGPFHLILVCTGILHGEDLKPEKKLSDLTEENLQQVFQVNTFGPALIMRHFYDLLSKERSIFGFISAKVGSIEDNRLGGWYSYRSSKAALNMILKTGAIEIARTRPLAAVVALHPGTVNSNLSAPFGGAEKGQSPLDAAAKMLTSLDQVPSSNQATFLSYDGTTLPW